MKTCSRCKRSLPLDDFHTNNRTKDKKTYWCKACCKEQSQMSEIQQAYRAKYREDHKDKQKAYMAEYMPKHAEKKREYDCSYRKEFRDKRREYQRNRYVEDTLYRDIYRVKTRVTAALTRGAKWTEDSPLYTLFGCTGEEFKRHIGPKPGSNFTLDHICPFAQAKTKDEAEKLCHYTNTRWLDGKDNTAKKHKRTEEAERMCVELLQREWDDSLLKERGKEIS